MSYVEFGVGLLALTGLTAGIGRLAGVGLGWFPIWVIVRASIQLVVVALLLHGILSVPWTVVGFIALMLTTASWTSARRLRDAWHGPAIAVVGVLTGATCTLIAIFALHLLPIDVRNIVAVG